jgi:hypothetical protein
MRITLVRSLVCTLPLTLLLACMAVPAPAFPRLQQPDSQDAPQYPSQDNPNQQQENSPPQDYSQPQDNSQPPDNGQANNGDYQSFSPDHLDNLLSPIALYPDPLLAQVFVAASFPEQIQEAAAYVRANGTNGIDDQNWDVSVRALAHYPKVVEMMADKIDWTTSLGQAYVNQSTDVSDAVQRLRHQARHVGNLESNPQQEIIDHDNYIAINPYQPQYLYVPEYDPEIIYFRRPYYGPAITFGVGFPIGGWLNLGFHWGYGGGFGGVYYTGWNPGGWGAGCWNCGWIGRSRGFVNFHNSVYINNRYNHITVNREVNNRTVNVSNINRYNSVHKNVSYNNVQANNARANRAGFAGNNAGARAGQNTGGRATTFNGNNRATANTNGSRTSQNSAIRNDRPVNNQQQSRAVQPQRSQTQSRPAVQSRPAQQNSVQHASGRPSGNVNSNSQRGQPSHQQAQRPAAQTHNAPQRQASHAPAQQHQASHAPAQHAAPRGGGEEKKKP